MKITKKSKVHDKQFEELTEDDDILAKIEDNVSGWFSYFQKNIEEYHKDTNFALGNQWEAHEIGEYYLRQKIILTINVLYSLITQIVAENRKNSPQVQVRSTDGKSSQQLINYIEGLLRHISYESNADIAYQNAFACALTGGFGAFRIVHEYENDESFNQVIRLLAIPDPLKAYFDPNALHPTKCDGEYCGIYTKMSLDEFKSIYPEIEDPESIMPPATWSSDFNWFDGDEIVLCEHFQRIWNKTKIYLLSNGDSVLEKDLADHLKELAKQNRDKKLQLDSMLAQHTQGQQEVLPSDVKDMIVPDVEVTDERDTEVCTIKHYKFIKGKILEETEFPGKLLPIVFVDGDSHFLDGKQSTRSFIKFSKDAQKFLNFTVSEIAQWLKIGHKGQFLATEAQIGDYKDLWRNPEKPSAALLYKPDVRSQNAAPVYIPPAELPQSLMGTPNSLIDMIQVITGRYEANKGAASNEMSGIAIANRSKQGNLATFVYIDNLNRAIEQAGKVCLGIIPNIYDTQRNIMIMGKDKKVDSVTINTDELKFTGKLNLDVTIGSGASFEMQKIDAFNQMMQFVNLNPQAFSTLLADLLAQNTNLDNTNQIVDRLRNFVVPPQVIAQETGQKLPPSPPNPQEVIADRESQARLMEAQAKIAKVQQDAGTSHVKAQAEVGKAQLDYKASVMDSMAKMHNTSLQAENDHLKRKLANISSAGIPIEHF